MKLRIFGMALLALAAMSAVAAMNASATPDGHFVHDGQDGEAWITAHEGATTPHALEFTRLASGTHNTTGEAIHCKTSTYLGTAASATVTSIQVTPTYTECTTSGGTGVVVDVNGCSYTFSSQGIRKHGTVNIDCPPEKAIEITHPNCNITIPAQTTANTLTEGISYKIEPENGKHILTATVTVNTITGHFHGGICIFLGTSHKFEMKGSVTVRGFEHLGGDLLKHEPIEGPQINITST